MLEMNVLRLLKKALSKISPKADLAQKWKHDKVCWQGLVYYLWMAKTHREKANENLKMINLKPESTQKIFYVKAAPNHHNFWDIMEGGMATTSVNSFRSLGCISLFPQACAHSGSSGGHEPDLHFQREGLCPLSPHPAVHPPRRCGKRGCLWREKSRSWEVAQPSAHHCYLCVSEEVHLLWPFLSD